MQQEVNFFLAIHTNSTKNLLEQLFIISKKKKTNVVQII